MNFIKKINTHLLENHPLIWNTRFLWMLSVGVITHLLFFIIGYFTVNNQLDISSEYRLSEFYFGSSVVFFNVLLSIIILLIWIIYYLQNNAFKNLYTIKKGTLSNQLAIILVVFFINTTQYYSFDQGLKLKIRNLYSWQEIDADIKEFNKIAIFLIQNNNKYSIDNKKYPSPFPLQYEVRSKRDLNKYIDTTKSYFNYNGNYYQFYKYNKKQPSSTDDEALAYDVYYKSGKNYNINKNINFEYRIVKDVVAYKEDIKNCLLNYSNTLYDYGQDSIAYHNRLKYYEDLFKRGDENEIKQNLQSFFKLAEKYQVDHNLNVDEWYGLLNENNYTYIEEIKEETASEKISEIRRIEKVRKNYPITQYILERKSQEWNNKNHNYTKQVTVDKRLINKYDFPIYDKVTRQLLNERAHKTYSRYKEVALSNIPYCNLGSLDKFFKNVYNAHKPQKEKEAIYFYICLSLFFGLLLFLFKVTDIKTLLLSFVAGALILIISGLSIAYIPRTIVGYSSRPVVEFVIAVIIGLAVIITSLMALNLKWNKLITSILFSLSIFAIPLTLMFMFLLYESIINYDFRSKDVLLVWLKKYVFWIIIFIWLIGLGYYTNAIRKWKALPE